MPVHFKTILLPISAAAIFALLAGNLAAQSTGPAALAAKQHIRDQVLAAMSDGKITPNSTATSSRMPRIFSALKNTSAW